MSGVYFIYNDPQCCEVGIGINMELVPICRVSTLLAFCKILECFVGTLCHSSKRAFLRSDTDVWQKGLAVLVHPKVV